MKNPHNLILGQTLWYVPFQRGYGPSSTSIEKLGKKWVTLSNGHRIDYEDLWADGGKYSSPGRAWLSAQQHSDESERLELWQKIRNAFVCRSPSVDLATMKKIYEMVGLG